MAKNLKCPERISSSSVCKRQKAPHGRRRRRRDEHQGNKFKNFTAQGIKRQLDRQNTTKYSTILEIPCLDDLGSRRPDDVRWAEQDLVQADNPAPVEIHSLEDVVKDNPSPLSIFTSVAGEEAPAEKTLRRSSRLSVLQNISCDREHTAQLNESRECRPVTLKTVNLRPRKASSRRQSISKTRADMNESGEKRLNFLVSPVRSAKWGVKRQANILIEVPPRPKDWWTWPEVHSPLFVEVPKRATADLEPAELPPRKRPRGRPPRQENLPVVPERRSRGRPRREETLLITTETRPRGRPRRKEPLPLTEKRLSLADPLQNVESTTSSKDLTQVRSVGSTEEDGLLDLCPSQAFEL